MILHCPYSDCSADALARLPGTPYYQCGECHRLSHPCGTGDCNAANRPFMRFCRRCGVELNHKLGPHISTTSQRRRSTVGIGATKVIGLRHIDSGTNAQDCQMVLHDGVLFLQFPHMITAVHPLLSTDRPYLCSFDTSADGPAFPLLLTDSTLVVASRKRIRCLALPLLWQFQFDGGVDVNGGRIAGPELIEVYRADEGWELASAPTILPSPSSTHDRTSLFVLLRREEYPQIEQWKWIQFKTSDQVTVTGKQSSITQNGSLEQVHGSRCRCNAINDRLVAVATDRGHWLIERNGHSSHSWEPSNTQCRRTLDEQVALHLDNQIAAVTATAIIPNGRGPKGDEYLRWFFVGDPDSLPHQRRLRHYTAKSPENRSREPAFAAGAAGLRPVGEVVTSISSSKPTHQLLCASANELHLCDIVIGQANNCDVRLDATEFRSVHASGNQAKLLWDGEVPSEVKFGLVEFDLDRAILALTLSMENLRGMPLVLGSHILAVQGTGEDCNLVCYQGILEAKND